MRSRPQTVFARNLDRLMKEKGWKPTPLSLAAGLSRTYVREILRGDTLNPGIDATQRLARVLECEASELMIDGNQTAIGDAEHDQQLRARALALAERAVGDDPVAKRAELVFRAAGFIYDVIVEREAETGRPVPDNDDELWPFLDAVARRYVRDMK